MVLRRQKQGGHSNDLFVVHVFQLATCWRQLQHLLRARLRLIVRLWFALRLTRLWFWLRLRVRQQF